MIDPDSLENFIQLPSENVEYDPYQKKIEESY